MDKSEYNEEKQDYSSPTKKLQKNLLDINAKEFIPKNKAKEKQSSDDIPNYNKEQNIKISLDSKEYIPKSKQVSYIGGNYIDNNFSKYNPNYQNYYGQQNNYSPNYYDNYEYQQTFYENKQAEDIVHNYSEGEDDDEDQEFQDKIFAEMMEENIQFEDDDESDEDKWFPKFRNCECCKGFVYKCEGSTCQNLGKCYCKIKSQMDGDNDDD